MLYDSLPVGDYYLVGSRRNLVVERKTIWDFVHSIGSRRLVDQCMRLVNVEEAEPRMIIEGTVAMMTKFSRFSPKSALATIASIVEDWKIPIYFVSSSKWTPILLEVLYTNIGKKKEKKLYPMRVVAKTYTLDDKARAVIEGFEGVGPSMADAILRHFGSIKEFVLGAERVDEIKGIGKKLKAKILEILYHRYGEDPGV